jgi:hypothetical protein
MEKIDFTLKVILVLPHMDVDSTSIFRESQHSTPKMEVACTSETLATLLTSTGCKGPRAESTSKMNYCQRPKSLITSYQPHDSAEQQNYSV